MDGVNRTSGRLLFVGATNRPNSIDPALRRPGRLEIELQVSVPDSDARHAILRAYCRRLRLGTAVDLQQLAERSPGFVGADLANWVREACLRALSEREMEGPATIDMCHFEAARKGIFPSSRRAAQLELGISKGWDDVGGLEQVKQALKEAVEWPLVHRDAFERLGLSVPRGMLLCGPPGMYCDSFLIFYFI